MLDILPETSETESVEMQCILVARGFKVCESTEASGKYGCGSEPAETKRAIMLERHDNHSSHQQQRSELELSPAIDD